MPRFNEKERTIIEERLRREGERLFSVYGFRKVTVADLAEAVNIAKGSFYSFFDSKEHLFLEIGIKIEAEMYDRLEKTIVQRPDFPSMKPKELTYLAIRMAIEGFAGNPILRQYDSSLIDHLHRKLPKEMMDQEIMDDGMVLRRLENYGVSIKVPYTVVVKALHVVFGYAVDTKGDEEKEQVVDLMIRGLTDQIVG